MNFVLLALEICTLLVLLVALKHVVKRRWVKTAMDSLQLSLDDMAAAFTRHTAETNRLVAELQEQVRRRERQLRSLGVMPGEAETGVRESLHAPPKPAVDLSVTPMPRRRHTPNYASTRTGRQDPVVDPAAHTTRHRYDNSDVLAPGYTPPEHKSCGPVETGEFSPSSSDSGSCGSND